MFTRRAVTASSLALIAGCATGGSSSSSSSGGAATRGAPAIGSFGVDMTSIDPNVKPGDDFFQYVNGTWLNNPANAIPADRTSWGTNVILADKGERDVKAIIDELSAAGGAPGSNEQKIADYYNSFLDQDRIDALGLAPLQPALTEAAALQTHEQVMRFIARSPRVAPPGSIWNYSTGETHIVGALLRAAVGRSWYLIGITSASGSFHRCASIAPRSGCWSWYLSSSSLASIRWSPSVAAIDRLENAGPVAQLVRAHA